MNETVVLKLHLSVRGGGFLHVSVLQPFMRWDDQELHVLKERWRGNQPDAGETEQMRQREAEVLVL